MHEFSLEILRCVRCGSKLDLQKFSESSEIDEGLLNCRKCNLQFPIISKLPILWDDFRSYISSRKVLGGKFYRIAKTDYMKKFLKKSFSKIQYVEDRSGLEDRWSRIYQNSKNSKFYSDIKRNVDSLPNSKLGLEYGCSIGIISSYLSQKCEHMFGIDRSFSALLIAKQSSKNNLDYVVADSLSDIFGKTKFDLIVALNVLEIIEPEELLSKISKQMKKGIFVISDPYDFDRGANSVKNPLDEQTLRSKIQQLGFKLSLQTKKPSYHPWNLKLNERATLNYKVDLIVAKKINLVPLVMMGLMLQFDS